MAGAEASALLEAAMELHQAGRLGEAEVRYRRVLELDPGVPDAHAYLGLLLHQRGASEAGVESLRRAVTIAPLDPFHHANLGVVLVECGEREAALAAWREVVRLDPDDADGHFHIGLLLDELGDADGAIAAQRRAVTLAPGDAGAHAALAGALRGAGDAAAALDAAARAVALDRGSGAAARQHGASLAALGRDAEAEAAYRRALELDPGHAPTWHNVGSLALDAGRAADALATFERAVALAGAGSQDAGTDGGAGAVAVLATLGAARALAALARPADALERCRRARAAAVPGSAAAREVLACTAAVLQRLDAGADAGRLAGELLACLDSDAVEPQSLARACARVLRGRVRGLLDAGAQSAALEAALESDPLWLSFLTRTINVDPEIESVIARLRALQLERVGEPAPPTRRRHAAAIAAQALAAEYAVPVPDDERAALDALWVRLAAGGASHDEHALIVASAYRSPEALPGAALDALLEADATGPDVRALLVRAVVEPRAEREIAEGLPVLCEVRDATSRAVREQYEENPYPRWQALAAGSPTSIAEMLRRRCPEHGPAPILAGRPDVLVAGCGTGREALDIAVSCPGTAVTAVDLSRRSLAYGARMASERGVTGIRFVHGDILDLGRLARRYPVIVSSGVLHHMDDPMAGWQVLRDLLEPGGVMRVGLYSGRARIDVAAARGRIAERGIAPSADAIRRFRAEILAAGPDDPLAGLRTSDDLYTTSACRDLLFHVCERTFDPAGIAEALAMLGLDFLGFEIPDPATWRGFRAANPQPRAHLDLAAWDRFEQAHPQTFVGMLQFWCARPGSA